MAVLLALTWVDGGRAGRSDYRTPDKPGSQVRNLLRVPGRRLAEAFIHRAALPLSTVLLRPGPWARPARCWPQLQEAARCLTMRSFRPSLTGDHGLPLRVLTRPTSPG